MTAPTVSLELQVQLSGRWQIQETYALNQREGCEDNAKRLFATGQFEATRVVREKFNPATSRFHEEVLYRSPDRPKPKPQATAKAKPRTVPKGAKARDTSAPIVRRREPAQPTRRPAPLPRIAIVCAVSLCLAALISLIVIKLFQALPEMYVALGRTGSEVTVYAVFIGSFLLTFFPMMRRVKIQNRGAAQPQQAAAAAPQSGSTIPPKQEEIPEPAAAFEEPLEEEVAEPEPEPEEEISEPEPLEEEPTAGMSDPAALAKADAEMLQFIGDCLAPLAAAGTPLDAFTRFGLTLYFAGAGENLAAKHRIMDKEIQTILCDHVQKLGQSREVARGFCANIDEYLVNPKYFQMYEAGRAAMLHKSIEPDHKPAIQETMKVWLDPVTSSNANNKEFVAVLFTDIVGSTALTQERGDDAAQLVVREHNRIVREALALFGGREIKHTGDGIMATFPQITNAADGAVAMQLACQRSNAANPDLGLGLCIGINAGEPIHEDGDIFGTPVQMAARVLSIAEGDEITVSNLVREMLRGKDYDFAKKGDFDLKGFAEPVPIFLLSWQDTAAAPAPTEDPVVVAQAANS